MFNVKIWYIISIPNLKKKKIPSFTYEPDNTILFPIQIKKRGWQLCQYVTCKTNQSSQSIHKFYKNKHSFSWIFRKYHNSQLQYTITNICRIKPTKTKWKHKQTSIRFSKQVQIISRKERCTKTNIRFSKQITKSKFSKMQ